MNCVDSSCNKTYIHRFGFACLLVRAMKHMKIRRNCKLKLHSIEMLVENVTMVNECVTHSDLFFSRFVCVCAFVTFQSVVSIVYLTSVHMS